MLNIFLFNALFLFAYYVNARDNISISFSIDYKDPYYLSLFIDNPDGKIQTRVSNLNPNQTKSDSLAASTEIFIAD